MRKIRIFEGRAPQYLSIRWGAESLILMQRRGRLRVLFMG
jgi:hypothetical protein